jgi:hypothetical protein
MIIKLGIQLHDKLGPMVKGRLRARAGCDASSFRETLERCSVGGYRVRDKLGLISSMVKW